MRQCSRSRRSVKRSNRDQRTVWPGRQLDLDGITGADLAIRDDDRHDPGLSHEVAHGLAPRHLEPVLQALVREGILKGLRGPRGGYILAGDPRRITAADIFRAARTLDEGAETPIGESSLVNQVVAPMLAGAENAFSSALARISLEDLT